MKPQNKHQAHVLYLSQNSLAPISAKQIAWAYQNCLIHEAYRTQKLTSCLDCGHRWPTTDLKAKKCVCPSCAAQLTVKDSRKLILNQEEYLGIVEVCEEYQVNRFFHVWQSVKAGEKPARNVREVLQQWVLPNGKHEIISVGRGFMGGGDGWHYGNLEIKKSTDQWRNNLIWSKWDITPTAVYPEMEVLPIYRRNGFKNNFHGLSPWELFYGITNRQRAETLLKTNQPRLLYAEAGNRRGDINQFWDSIKIAIRNKYKIADAGMWLDYLKFLKFFGKDLQNAHYVCPDNLKKAHNEYMALKKIADERAEVLRKERDAAHKLAQKQQAQQMRDAFCDLEFGDGKFVVVVLKTEEDYKQEGEALKHCVHSGEYFNVPESLVFSARIDGKPIETIEVILPLCKIEQARGWDNKPTKYHDEILRLMKKNLKRIRKRYNEIHKPVAHKKAA